MTDRIPPDQLPGILRQCAAVFGRMKAWRKLPNVRLEAPCAKEPLKQQACLEAAEAIERLAAMEKTVLHTSTVAGDLTYKLAEENKRLRDAIIEHRNQKADDRCIEDDDRLYAALGDGIPCDRRVGDKTEMLINCARFIERRCESGGWPTYRDLEQQNSALCQRLDERARECKELRVRMEIRDKAEAVHRSLTDTLRAENERLKEELAKRG